MDITKLATLARIKLSPEEEKSLSLEFESILGYVDQIRQVDVGEENLKNLRADVSTDLVNVMRNDEDANQNGVNKDILLSLSPQREGDYVKVKKIL